MKAPTPAHPCPFTRPVLDLMAQLIDEKSERHHNGIALRVLDPNAGTGVRVHEHVTSARHIWTGLELEESFIAAPWVRHGDATAMPFADGSFDVIASSFVFPNRMTDDFISSEAAAAKWTYNTYSHKARRNRDDRMYKLDASNAGAMGWGREYRDTYRKVLSECARVLKPNGLLLVEMKNHYANGQLMNVTVWFERQIKQRGFRIDRLYPISVRGNLRGANANMRCNFTTLIMARK